ncbi:hypothetical protein MD484_g6966, partial [Candolleomyces efflorescens]
MPQLRRKPRQNRRSRSQTSPKQPSRRGLLVHSDSTVGHPKKIIRLYKNSKLALLPQPLNGTGDVDQGLPHPRPPHLRTSADSRMKYGSQRPEVSDVPLPIAATAVDAKEDSGIGYALLKLDPSSSPKSAPLHSTAAKSLEAPSFSPLPPLPSLVISTSAFVPLETQGSAITATSTATHGYSSQTAATGSNSKLGVSLIVLLSVAGGCIAVGFYLLFRFLTRPRRPRIKPSLPIIEKSYVYDDYNHHSDGKESPVFGGKERSASRLESEVPLWTWVQYSKPELKEPELSSELRPNHNENSQAPPGNTKNVRTPSLLLPVAANPSMGAQKRMSSASLYRHRESKDIGVAITGDGYPILERSRSKLARRSQSYSVLTDRKRRDSAYRPDSAYEGADVSSPTTYFQPVTTPTIGGATPTLGSEGRARIQSSYYAVAPYPRLSSLPMSYSIGTARKVPLSQAYAPGRGDKVNGSDSQAVTANDGQTAPSSPEATLYPDDSMSVIASAKQRRLSRSERKRVSRYLGNATASTGLPEMDFGASRMSLSDLAEESSRPDDRSPNMQKGPALQMGTPHDRPPRVPSPPPLPSLAQMALAHSNPDAYTTYRSPTYSIYGLYGNERKSNVTNLA